MTKRTDFDVRARSRIAREAAAIERNTRRPADPDQVTQATMLLADLWETAARHGVTVDDLDAVVALPMGVLMALHLADRRRERSGGGNT